MKISTGFIILLIILPLVFCTSRRIDSFTQMPPNPVLEGDMVVVWCIGFGNSQRWYINSILVRSSTFNSNVYRINHYGDTDVFFWNTSVTFTATLDKNETDIRCDMVGSSTDDARNSTTLILAGPPTALITSLEDLNDGMVLRLSWTEPFTQAQYPVTSYHVVIYNVSVGADNVLINSFLNATQHHYDFVKPSNSSTCLVVVFTVSAINAIGISNTSTELGVYSMVPDINDLNISQEVVFVDDRTPLLIVWFQEPTVCSLQEQFNYTLEVLDESGHVVVSSGLREARAGSDGRVVTKFVTGLSPNMDVSIRLTLMHSSLSRSLTATQENISIPTLQSTTQSDSPTEMQTLDSSGTATDEIIASTSSTMTSTATEVFIFASSRSVVAIVGGVAAAVVVLILLGVVIIAVIFLHNKRKIDLKKQDNQVDDDQITRNISYGLASTSSGTSQNPVYCEIDILPQEYNTKSAGNYEDGYSKSAEEGREATLACSYEVPISTLPA